MNKKLLCIAMALILTSSTAVVAADAATVKESSSTEKGTIKFDSGDWNSSMINFYIWDENTGLKATKSGWVEADPWGSKKKIGGTAVEGEAGVFESYEIELDDTHDYYVIFHDPDKGQTYDCCLNSSCFGLTAAKTGVRLEGPDDSENVTEEVAFPNGVGAPLTITCTGEIQGSYISPNVDRADKVAQFVLKYLGFTNKITNESVVTETVVADAIAAFETTANDVWAAYKNHSDHENYNEEEAKKVIKPTEEEPAPVDSDNPVTGTIKFDSGDWQSKSMLFYIWDSNGKHATKSGWVDADPWGSKKKTGGTAVEGEDGVFESFEFEMDYNTDYFVIFYDPDHGQTFDCCMDPSCFGLTAYMTGNLLENPVDSEKMCIEAVFPNGMGPALTITSSGNVIGSYVSPRVDRADKVARFVLDYLGVMESVSGKLVVTEESVANAIAAFETTADDVWKAYLKYEGEPNFNEEEAKKVIKPVSDIPDSPDTPDTPDIERMQEVHICGDYDGDGEIAASDALAILRESIGISDKEGGLKPVDIAYLDVDGDGELTAQDAISVLSYSVGIPSGNVGHEVRITVNPVTDEVIEVLYEE